MAIIKNIQNFARGVQSVFTPPPQPKAQPRNVVSPYTNRATPINRVGPVAAAPAYRPPTPAPKPSGGGGGGGGYSAPQSVSSPFQDLGSYYEQAPGYEEPDFNSLIAPALEALGQAETAAQSLFGARESEIAAGQQQRVATAQQQQKSAEGELATRQTRAETQAESAIGEARRGFSELSQGLLARYGAGVSTGEAAQSILGTQTMKNIGEIRTQLSQVVSDIETTRQATKDVMDQAIKQSEAEAQTLKQKARSELQGALADIGSQRGQLQSRKAELVAQSLQAYRETVASVNQRNTSFQQQVYLQQQQADQRLQQAQAQAASRINSIKEFTLGPGQTRFQIGAGGAQEVARSPYLPQTVGTVGGSGGLLSPTGVGTVLSPEEQDLLGLGV